MATTFITYNQDNGFWIHESYMQLALHYMYEEVKLPQYIFPKKQEFLEDLEFHINGYSAGNMAIGFSDFILNITNP